MAKTVKVESVLEVRNAAQTVEARQVIKETVSVDEATQIFPQKIAPSQVDVPIAFAGVAQGRRVWLNTSHEVTLKVNNITDAGFPFGPGSGYLPSTTGITALYVSTGASETEVSAVIVGA